MSPGDFFAELKRRNVYKVAAAYAVAAWLLIQIATQVFPFFKVPNWTVQLVVLLLILVFPVAMILAWASELTPGESSAKTRSAVESLERRGRKLTALVVVLAAAAVGLMVFRFVRSQQGSEAGKKAARTNKIESKSIAVPPFENLSDEKQNAYLVAGIVDEILIPFDEGGRSEGDLPQLCDAIHVGRIARLAQNRRGTGRCSHSGR